MPNIYFIIKTHYISQMHINVWLDLQSDLRVARCIILLNNENNSLSHFIQYLFDEIKNDIFTFTSDSFRDLNLPVTPFEPASINSWRNGDYGTYLVRTLLPDLKPTDWIIQIDNDIILAGGTWSQFFDLVKFDSIEFFSKTIRHVNADWPHFEAARHYYGQNNVYQTLFGLQGYTVSLVDYLFSQRRQIAEFYSSILEKINLNIKQLDKIQANKYWPLCEAFVGSEIIKTNVARQDMETDYPEMFKTFVYSEKLWPKPGERFNYKGLRLVHPAKCPVYCAYGD
ncbi:MULTISPECIES: hypothetical protein [Methylomonas]|uniref:hypothetical protein n=1 Tax=Methylomonas TaxID=416 RepID=UPI001232C02D|nr:hypothetical protein [Methylomonas rhizoryzae]